MLTTSRLSLRRARLDDLNNLNDLDNDPEVMRWINGGVAVTIEHTRQKTLPLFMTPESGESSLGFWIVENAGSKFLGWLSMRPTDTAGEVAVGYRFVRSSWGCGYATESMALLIKKAFSKHEVKRVIAHTFEKNTASLRVMEKLGMKLTKRYRVTPDDLEETDTSIQASSEPWDGDELEYSLER